jgi:hypothetical protein
MSLDGSNTYPDGIPVAMFYTRVHHRLLHPRWPPTARRTARTVTRPPGCPPGRGPRRHQYTPGSRRVKPVGIFSRVQ